MHKKKWFIFTIIFACLFLIAIFSFKPFIYYLGQKELHALAQDKNYCHSNDCSEGIAYVSEILHQQFGIEKDLIPWCMATNRLYSTDFYFLNPLMQKVTDSMYQSCEHNDLTLEDANIEIGDQHIHEHEE